MLKKPFKLLFLMFFSFTCLFASGKTGKNNISQIKNSQDYEFLNYNNIFFPIDNRGVLGDVNNRGAQYNGKVFLFSGGFFLSGTDNGNIWGNGVMSASRIYDYLPGLADPTSAKSVDKIYLLTKDDTSFGQRWQDWEEAVAAGADFYDGDHDGKYNPVDKNGNGIWDTDEDRPPLLGDFTTWCVFNDGQRSDIRTFSGVEPKGIEVRQTVFGFYTKSVSEQANTIFIRYQILNTGTKSNTLDSVYFSAACDPDLGDYTDDLLGCDTTLNSVFVYNNGADKILGSNPPCFLVDLLQGPIVYEPGVTFKDNNNNGKYDEGIDTPLQYAYNIKGNIMGVDTIKGARNLQLTSFQQYMQSHPFLGDPATQYELRNYMLGGKGKDGINISPCTFALGNGDSLSNCDKIDAKYFYSGDPVAKTGWLNTTPQDQRFMANCGPFTLEKGKPQSITVAYVIGQGSDAINSITVAKNYAKSIKKIFASNFTQLTDVKETAKTEPNTFELYQNYPNPFNPATTIKYSLPATQNISLKVYNTLGELVATLANGMQSAGLHHVAFDGSKFSSGVYFYVLKTPNGISSKKLLLLK